MATHQVSPAAGFVHFDFDRDRPATLRVDSGDTVVFETLDASAFLEPRPVDDHPVRHFEPGGNGHALCGPVEIAGAKAGQTLEVDIIDIRTGTWGWTVGGGWKTDLNERLGVAGDRGCMLIWELDPDTGVGVDQFGHRVELNPFMGVMGMPSDEPGPLLTFPPRFCGGNLDCKELVAGTKLYLPIAVDGALFSLGDGHALQGDGEVSGTAIECPMERVEVKLTVVDEPTLTMPRAWTPDAWIALGVHEDLREATAIAIDQMLELMCERMDLVKEEAITLASLLVDVRVTQLVNGVVGVHAMLAHTAIG